MSGDGDDHAVRVRSDGSVSYRPTLLHSARPNPQPALDPVTLDLTKGGHAVNTESNQSFFDTLRTRFAARAAQRQARLELTHDLAQFRTYADRIELDAILDRNPGADADFIRALHNGITAGSGSNPR